MIYVKKKHMHTIMLFLDRELDRDPENTDLREIKNLLYWSIFFGNDDQKSDNAECKV